VLIAIVHAVRCYKANDYFFRYNLLSTFSLKLLVITQ